MSPYIMSDRKSNSESALRPGSSEVGRVVVDERGRNVWQWNDASVQSAGTTTLLRKLDNTQLGIADTQMWRKQDTPPARRPAGQASNLTLEEAGDHLPPKRNFPGRNARLRKKDAGGGFNPYG